MQLNKKIAKKMNNPLYFTNRALRIRFNITLESHHINHTNSKIIITPNFPEFGIEVRYIDKIIKEFSVIYARLINQYKFKYQTVYSARFDKQDEDNRVLEETEIFNKLNINQNLTESDLDNNDIKPPLEHQIQHQEMKYSCLRFDKIFSMLVYFYKTGELIGSNYVKITLRSNAILNMELIEYCFLWSLLANLHPCNNTHSNRVSNYRQYFNELNIQDFDFTNGFRCSDIQEFEKLNNLTIDIFELNCYQDENEWRRKLIPIEVSKTNQIKL